MGSCVNSLLLRLAVSLVRGWTRAYTWRMPAGLGESRCAEIESDLWELQQDPDRGRGLSPAGQVIGRFFMGLPDDVFWRVEQAVDGNDRLRRRTVALTAAATCVLVVLWVLPGWLSRPAPSGRTRLVECANSSAPPQTTAEFRTRVITCAGVFFTPGRDDEARIRRP
jgi:hypothetical protein